MSNKLSELSHDLLAENSKNDEVFINIHKRLWIYILLGLLLSILLFCGIRVHSIANWHGSAMLHTVMEAMATLLSCIVGVMALVRYYSRKDYLFLFIGAGFLGTSSLDGFHTIVTSAYFKPMMPSSLPHLIPWSWVASRLLLATSLLLSWLAWLRVEKLGESGRYTDKTVYLSIIFFTLFSFCFFIFYSLPAAYYPDLYFHRPEEFIPAIFFLAALLGYLYKGKWRTNHFEHWLVIALIISFVCQAVFMSRSGQLFDFDFDVAHMLKKLSYICVLIGLLISMYNIFKREEEKGIVALRQAYYEAEKEIKQRKKMQVQLVLREKELLRSNQELEKFSYIASHDLQEPLRKIQSFGDLLINKYSDGLDTRAIDYLQRMQRAANRMSSLINDLLALSRVGSKNKEFSLINLNEVISEVQCDLELLIQESKSQIIYKNLPSIDADKMLMHQLFQNLISNAIKFRKEGRQSLINISSEIIKDVNDVDEFCILHITDNGIGFDEKYKDRIFEVFQRLQSDNKISGSGIGLAIVRRIIDLHGGEIKAVSIPGEGTTFSVKLKIKQVIKEVKSDD